MQQRPTIHVLDDDDSFHAAVSRLLRSAGYEVRNYTDAGRFLLADFDGAPGCILLDVWMPGFNGLDLQEALIMRTETLPIIFLSAYGDIPSTVRAMKAGAIDFLTKPVHRTTLLNALSNALAQDAKERVFRERLRHWRADYDTLTTRELEVFNRVIVGKMNKVIAGELRAAERTVKAHRSQVMKKMHAGSVAELVHIADQLQMTKTPPGKFPHRVSSDGQIVKLSRLRLHSPENPGKGERSRPRSKLQCIAHKPAFSACAG